MSDLPLMPEALRHSWRNLSALIEATAERQVVPCFNGTDVPRMWWTSDDQRQRAEAATACAICPVLTQCSQYGIDNPKEVGVYGGMSERQRVKVAREISERTAA
ncbi:WhiB family transcriptional regulator [Demequina lutea]|uniref:4Fe-4S Wbl-type domain-containing protein n=1 Tax=Demequina lutea TaxID=431489 RepID=A0A7Y9Z9E4_9MICO|nr:WhiB family transcriptional regulator [Demequina lutea]NYI41244.1 hypothetical protein [Demequina lutea]